MAADRRRKRMSRANITGFSYSEHYRTKKKNMASTDNGSNPRDHINLEWDRNQKKVVSKSEQVGLSLSGLRPFVDSIPHRRNILADLCFVPREIFEWENLSEVLSYEVWQTHLSEGERNHLLQFLPRGVDVDQVVQVLLDGDNFHFGNPFLHWGIAVCSGNLHPDGILSREERLKADKGRYYRYLQTYHYDIIDYLQKLKKKWESCKDPEKDIVQKMWGRSRGDTTHINDSWQDLKQYLTDGSESCSWNADEKPCSSGNRSSSVLKTGEVQNRSKGFHKTVEKEKFDSPLIAPYSVLNGGAKARKKNLPGHSIQQTDGAKYMSYLKIRKKQHQIVTSMKQSGKSIPSRVLIRILGNIDKLDVQPYGLFVEEEKKKLNAYWLQLVTDLPAAYEIWKEKQLQKQEIIGALERELEDKLNPLMEDEQKLDPAYNLPDTDDVHLYARKNGAQEENPESFVPDSHDVAALDQGPEVEASRDSNQISTRNQSPHDLDLKDVEQVGDLGRCSQFALPLSQVCSPNGGDNVKLDDREEKPYSFPNSPQNKSSSPGSSHDIKPKDVEENKNSCSLQDNSFPQIASVGSDHVLKLTDVDSMGKHCCSELENVSSIIPEQSVNEMIPLIAPGCRDSQFSSGGDVWPAVGIGQSYIDPTPQAYPTSGGLAISHTQGEEGQETCFINLESNVCKASDGKNVLQRQSVDGSLGPFPNKDQWELFQSLCKGQGMPAHNPEQLHALLKGPGIASHNQEHKKMIGIDFQKPGNILMDSGQFLSHFQNQIPPPPQALMQDQRRQNDGYDQGSIQGNNYCGGVGYLMQRQQHLRRGRLHDWDTSPAQIGVPMQPLLDSGQVLSQNWMSGEHQQQLRSMWTDSNGVGYPSPGLQTGADREHSNGVQILNRGNNSDQSLFSVLSQCNQMHSSRGHVEPMGRGEQLIAPRSYGMMGGETSQIPVDYLGGSNTTTPLMLEDVSWMNQNSIHDPLGKLYPRSWNQ